MHKIDWCLPRGLRLKSNASTTYSAASFLDENIFSFGLFFDILSRVCEYKLPHQKRLRVVSQSIIIILQMLPFLIQEYLRRGPGSIRTTRIGSKCSRRLRCCGHHCWYIPGLISISNLVWFPKPLAPDTCPLGNPTTVTLL